MIILRFRITYSPFKLSMCAFDRKMLLNTQGSKLIIIIISRGGNLVNVSPHRLAESLSTLILPKYEK